MDPDFWHAVEKHVAPDLRRRLEAARLDILTLFRTLDSLHLAQDPPDELHDLFELAAVFAEALAVLDHPVAGMTWPGCSATPWRR